MIEKTEIEGLTCSQCGGPVPSGALKCSFCTSGFAKDDSEEKTPDLKHPRAEFIEKMEATYRELEPEKWDKLMEIRKIVEEKFPDQFPEACCDLIAQEISDRPDLNLRIIAGTFQADDGEKTEHIWAYDKIRQVFVDAGADAFSEFSQNPIVVFHGSNAKKLGYKQNIIKTAFAHFHMAKNI
jgi:hypothetical protein